MCWHAVLPRPPVSDYRLHQVLWTYLPKEHSAPGSSRPFVFRVEGDRLRVLSRHRLNTASCALLNGNIVTGLTYQFDLLCSPARGKKDQATGEHRRRVFYRGHEERRAWLGRRLEGAAEVLFARSSDMPVKYVDKPGGAPLRVEECRLSGTLRVTDRAELLSRLSAGIGGRGAWGHGLLYLPEVMG